MHRKNNFDFLRLLFASFVLITHSYSLSGIKECDWLCQLTNGQVSFSSLGVKGFFIISGYLIFQSMERSKGFADYYRKRVLRLFPALIVVLLLTVLLAPLIYQGPIPYFKNDKVWTYLPNNLSLYKLQYNIPGVFDNNVYKGAINGSLWTIPYEFTMYVVLSLLILFKNTRLLITVILVTLLLLFTVVNVFFSVQIDSYSFILEGNYFFSLGMYFLAGSLLAAVKIKEINARQLNIAIAATFIVLISSTVFSHFNPVAFFTLPIIIIGVGIRSAPGINSVGDKLGDLSYGIYIYGFPVQQTLMHFYPFNYLGLMMLSLPISYVLAYCSWHLVEAKALAFKKPQNKVI
jgi:peptidoglycan/LPS O-acetylase OafA/YrhL